MNAMHENHKKVKSYLSSSLLQSTDLPPQPENVFDCALVCDELVQQYQEYNSGWENACCELIQIVADLKEASNKLATLVNELFKQNKELKNTVKQLEDKLEDITHPNELLLGQIAFMVEEKVLTYVMKDIDEPNKRSLYKIHELEKAIAKKARYLDVFECEEERQTAENRWNNLKSKLGWHGKHYRDLDRLKEFRVEAAAHPKMSPLLNEELIEKVCGEDKLLKGICNDFLCMLDKISKS